ncbi:MAG: hypothetical protein CML23_21740 [Rhizobiaceae bacterium]|nr:hypothetical protein [Rhizobiaceae bacterium]
MMRDARIEQPFGDGIYPFRLGYGQITELQEKCDCGPMRLLSRLQSGDWKIEDVFETVRIGLIGGGMEPKEALKLAGRYVKERPPLESHPLALAIVFAGLAGAPDETVGE